MHKNEASDFGMVSLCRRAAELIGGRKLSDHLLGDVFSFPPGSGVSKSLVINGLREHSMGLIPLQ